MRTSVLLVASSVLLAGADNTLTGEERRAAWVLLFDGATMKGWRDPAKLNLPGDAWEVRDDCLKTRLNPRIREDLITGEAYGDFELKFDWRLSLGANTGVKYRIQDAIFIDDTKIQAGPSGFEGMLGREMAKPLSDRSKLAPGATGQLYTVAFEMQLIDDERHRDAQKDARHVTGALYSMIAPAAKAAKPAGEWNAGYLKVTGSRFEHWINGTKVLEGSLDDPAVRAGVQKRWPPAPKILEMLMHPKPRGPLCLQHHGDEVWFKNLKVHRLD